MGEESVGEMRRDGGSAVVVPGIHDQLLVRKCAGVRIQARAVEFENGMVGEGDVITGVEGYLSQTPRGIPPR